MINNSFKIVEHFLLTVWKHKKTRGGNSAINPTDKPIYYTLFKCAKCRFKTDDEDKMLGHEHEEFDVSVSLTDEKSDGVFGR